MSPARLLAEIEFRIIRRLGRIFGISLVTRYLRNPNPAITIRLLREFGACIGEGSTFKRSIILDNVEEDRDSVGDFSFLVVGNNCFIGDEVYLDLANKIVIADNVMLSGRVSILTHSDCNRSHQLTQFFPRKCHPTYIDSDCWIGFSTTLLPGVHIAGHSVIAAGTVVRGKLAGNTLYGGVPVKPIKPLIDNEHSKST